MTLDTGVQLSQDWRHYIAVAEKVSQLIVITSSERVRSRCERCYICKFKVLYPKLAA